MKKVITLVIFCVVAGCSNQQVYENIQQNNKNACTKLPPSQYEECIEKNEKSFEEYERDRKAAIEN